jgi:hypothetical protein
MCVNFSASQFAYQADLIPKVLADADLDPEGLRLETSTTPTPTERLAA